MPRAKEEVITDPIEYLQKLDSFFQDKEIRHLPVEEASFWIFTVILENGSAYGLKLVELLEQRFPRLSLSDTILYKALDGLLDSGVVNKQLESNGGKGRPRSVYRLNPEFEDSAKELSRHWLETIANAS